MALPFPRRRPTRSASAAVALSGLLSLSLAGCGGAASSQVDEAARKSLHADVERIRAASDSGQAAAVARFRTAVRRLLDDGGIDSTDGRVLLAQADQLASRIRADAPTATPTPTRAAPPAPVPAPRDEPKPGKDGKPKKKHGKHD